MNIKESSYFMFFMEYFTYYLQVNKVIVLCNFCHNSTYFQKLQLP